MAQRNRVLKTVVIVLLVLFVVGYLLAILPWATILAGPTSGIGGLALLVVILLAIFWLLRKQGKKARQKR